MTKRFSVLAVLAVTLWSLQSQATVVRRASLDELAQASAVIVHAVVSGVNEEVAKTPRGPFRTFVDLEILEGIKGTSDNTLHLDLPGGRGFGRTAYIPGMPRFVAGDEVVLLLERTQNGYALAGLSQGVFFVHREGASAEVVRDFSDVAFVGKAGISGTPHRLEDLLATLRRLAGGAR